MWRRALTPFNRYERKLKQAAERFVVNTVKKRGLPSYHQKVELSMDTTPETLPGVVQASSNGTINLMLALLKASQRAVVSKAKTFEAISLGDGRLLVSHPSSAFMYASASNVRLVPQLVLESYQEQATIAIEREVDTGDCVIILGAGQGYHMLSIASAVGEEGRVVAMESKSTELDILRMNIEAHALDQRVQVCDYSNDDFNFDRFIDEQQAVSIFYIASDFDIPEAWVKSLSEFSRRSTETLFIIGTKRQSMADFALTRSTSNVATKKRAA